jgi:hypothetical protein
MAPPETPKITKFLKPGASRGKAVEGDASGGSRSVVLHVGPAAAAVPEKPSGLLGRIVELNRAGKDLGHLLPYAQKWNDADISASTRGLGKDRLPAPDPAGPRSTEEHFTRLKRAVKEFDSAWYDATSNVVVSFANPLVIFVDAGLFSFQILSILPVPEFRVESVAFSAKL